MARRTDVSPLLLLLLTQLYSIPAHPLLRCQHMPNYKHSNTLLHWHYLHPCCSCRPARLPLLPVHQHHQSSTWVP
jgi:hypothetical protein